jgi:hypothetical protein
MYDEYSDKLSDNLFEPEGNFEFDNLFDNVFEPEGNFEFDNLFEPEGNF